MWFHGDISDAEVSLPGFNVIRTDRAEGKGGGVALYLHSDLKFSYLMLRCKLSQFGVKCILSRLVLLLASSTAHLTIS